MAKVGRPKLNDANKKTRRVNVRLTSVQYERFLNVRGKTLSAKFINLINGYASKHKQV